MIWKENVQSFWFILYMQIEKESSILFKNTKKSGKKGLDWIKLVEVFE